MLFGHFSGGFGVDTLHFDQIRADDPLVFGPEYVDVPRAALPKIETPWSACWWNKPPQFGGSMLGIFCSA